MISKKSVLVVIPARAGSKGVPDKNIRLLNGTPLIAHAIHFAISAGFSQVYVSTDSDTYLKIAQQAGADSLGLRKKELAGDHAKTKDVVLELGHSLEKLGHQFTHILLLQPTSPQRKREEIEGILELASHPPYPKAVVSVSKLDEPHPSKLKKITDSGELLPYLSEGDSETPRQLLDPIYQLTGAYYLIEWDELKREKTFFPKGTVPYITDEIVNLNSERDWRCLEVLFEDENA